jgi:hypothetical protein
MKDKSKILTTLDVGLEKSNNIGSTINYDFSTISSNYSKFDRNYKKVLDEFHSLGWGETPAYLEDNKKLRLKALQTQVDKMKEQPKSDFGTKLKEMNFNYFSNSKTLSSPAGSKSPISNLKNLSSVKNEISKEKFTIDDGNKKIGSPITENDLVSEKYKFKIKEIMKKTEEAAKRANLKVNDKITKENLMAEFKLFEKEREGKFNRNGKSVDGVKNFLIPQEKKVQWNDSFDNSPSKRQNTKKEIFNLLGAKNDSPQRDITHKRSSTKNLFFKMKTINTNESLISKNKNNLSMNLIDSGKKNKFSNLVYLTIF